MTVIEKMAEPIAKEMALLGNCASVAEYSSDAGWEDEMEISVELMRKALTALRDEFADPVVRAAIQSVLDGA